jgi:hypothetical protein
MLGVWTASKFLYDRIAAISNVATRAPGGIHEDEVPKKLANGTSTANKTAITYQIEVGESALGQGATHVWDEITALVDVIVPGTSKAAGRTLQEDIYMALHAQSGSNAYGSVSSCVYRGVVPIPPEHIAATGESYEHLTTRYELHCSGTP